MSPDVVDENGAGSQPPFQWISTPHRPLTPHNTDLCSPTFIKRPSASLSRFRTIYSRPPPPYRPRQIQEDPGDSDLESEFSKDESNSMLAAFLVVHDTFKDLLSESQNDIFSEYQLPTFPLKTLHDLELFESKMATHQHLRLFLVHKLSSVTGTCIRTSTRKILLATLSRELAASFTLRGRRRTVFQKPAFDQLSLYKCIVDAIRKQPFKFDLIAVDYVIGVYLSRSASALNLCCN